MASESASMPGLYVHGELRGGVTEAGKPRPNGEGHYPDRYILTLRAGDDSFRIEYRDEAAAREAVEKAKPGAVIGDSVTLPVGVRARARGGADAFAFYFGRGAAAGDEREALSW